MTSRGTLLLSRSDVSSLLTLGDCITAVESAFRGLGEGRTPSPSISVCPPATGASTSRLRFCRWPPATSPQR